MVDLDAPRPFSVVASESMFPSGSKILALTNL
jgi:hypothetical protein